MNKLFYFFALSFLAAPLFAAASTCETRVDKNLDKSTSEKVDRCLTDEVTVDEGPVTEVVLSDTYSVQYPKPKTKAKKSAQSQQVTRVYTSTPVSQEYLERDDYPAFRNDTLPNINAEQAHEAALQALRPGAKNAKSTAKPAKKNASKPTRQKAAPAAQTVPTQTPPAEIAQAQALENDPLYQDVTDGGATPAGFTDGGVMGPAGFGYNATDPALQP